MRALLVGICVFVFSLLGFCQLPSIALLSVDVREKDWGLKDWSLIRLGQLSLLHERKGDQLHAQVLSDAEPPGMPKSPRNATPSCEGNCFLVSSFEGGSRNQLGGYFNAFSRKPSAAQLALMKWEDGHRALTLDFNRAGAGYSGMWIHLFDFRQPLANRVYLNVGQYAFLTFWIRGQQGNEQVLLKASDAAWEMKEDGLPIGELGSFLVSGKIERSWQQAVVPLTALPRNLNSRQLASLIFEAAGTGEGRIAIKDLAFCVRPKPLPGLTPASASPGTDRKLEKALWVWNTAEILPVAAQQNALADFCRRHGIVHLYLQLPKQGGMGPGGAALPLGNGWKQFLSLLAGSGIRAYALDGYKEFALPEWHDRVLETVDKVIAYNRAAAPDERFAGIHYDIEPYLLPGFHGPRRSQIFMAYLNLLEKMSARIQKAGMTFGVDLPFWYDTTDALTGKDFAVEFHGQHKPASEHIIDLVDSVGNMDYRTFTFGADGIAAQAEGELTYAASVGKKVFVGLETIELPDEDLIHFNGKPTPGLPDRAPGERVVVLEPIDAGARIWLIHAQQWEGFSRTARERKDPEAFRWWSAGKTVAVPSGKLTFARLGAGKLQQAMSEAEEELSRWPSFAGFALHDYIGLQSIFK